LLTPKRDKQFQPSKQYDKTLPVVPLMRAKDGLEILFLIFKCQEVGRGLHRIRLQRQHTNVDESQGFRDKVFVSPLHRRFSKKRQHNKEQF
jgi:hypothetical protein